MSQAPILKAEYEGLLLSIEKYVSDSLANTAKHKGYEV